jgi:hypothetical protein
MVKHPRASVADTDWTGGRSSIRFIVRPPRALAPEPRHRSVDGDTP